MCRVLEVSRSGYYDWLKRKEVPFTLRQKKREENKQKIKQFFHESFGTYGAVRIHKDMEDAGIEISERTVGRYMQSLGLKAIPTEPYTVTTDSNHEDPIFEDLLQQNFEAEHPNQIWASDITYIWTPEGWVYLAATLDLCSRRAIGWYAADHLKKELTLNALNMAVATRQPEKDLIHHSDRGSQYASNAFREELKIIGAQGSMSRKGNPFDNACVESFFATLKKELIYRRTFKTKREVIQAINWYISAFYNEKRRHSKNDYLSPNQYERKLEVETYEKFEQPLKAG